MPELKEEVQVVPRQRINLEITTCATLSLQLRTLAPAVIVVTRHSSIPDTRPLLKLPGQSHHVPHSHKRLAQLVLMEWSFNSLEAMSSHTEAATTLTMDMEDTMLADRNPCTTAMVQIQFHDLAARALPLPILVDT